MLPRHVSDYRTIAWCLAMPIVAFVQYRDPRTMPYLAWVSAYLALAAGVIAHNHNHCPTFANKKVNALFANWISIFYGYPTFAWVPTHNLNHHKFVNKAGDATITWRYTNKDHWLVAATYFFVSSYYQSGPIKEYIRKAKANNPRLHRQIVTQYAVWAGAHLTFLASAIALHGWALGLKLFLFVFALPAFFALWTIMFFNYGQHVHTDPWSKHNHSRNFTSPVLNFLLFNNGLHAVHHENPGTHWSRLPELHRAIEAEIHPDLKRRSFWWWVAQRYLLANFVPSFRSTQIGRAPFDADGTAQPRPGESDRPALTTASVDALEAGSNAAMT